MNKKTLFLSLGIFFTLTGCGDKIIKMNEYKDINYSYHPRASTTLESDTYELLQEDKEIQKKMERYSKRLDNRLNETLNDISTNQNNSNIMISGNSELQRKAPENQLFQDRFDKLRLR